MLQFNETNISAKSTPVIIKKAAYVFCCCSVVTSVLLEIASISVVVNPVDNKATDTDGVIALYFLRVANKLEG